MWFALTVCGGVFIGWYMTHKTDKLGFLPQFFITLACVVTYAIVVATLERLVG